MHAWDQENVDWSLMLMEDSYLTLLKGLLLGETLFLMGGFASVTSI